MESRRIYKMGTGKEKLILDSYYEIKNLIMSGYTMRQASKELGISVMSIHAFFSLKKGVAVIGHKDQAYFTEEEMLTEKDYSFKNLSNDEKEIYKQREEAGVLGSHFTSNDGLHGGCQG